jgi:hypothetical protein
MYSGVVPTYSSMVPACRRPWVVGPTTPPSPTQDAATLLAGEAWSVGTVHDALTDVKVAPSEAMDVFFFAVVVVTPSMKPAQLLEYKVVSEGEPRSGEAPWCR